MSGLTESQRLRLDRAVFVYLRERGCSSAAEAFAEKLKLGAFDQANFSTFLERKWIALLQLQSRVDDLESKLTSQTVYECDAQTPTQLDDNAELSFLGEIESGSSAITKVSFHPTKDELFSTADDGSLRCFDVTSRRQTRTIQAHDNLINDIAFSHSGHIFATCSVDLSIKVWDTASFECIRTLIGHEHSVSAIEFTPSDDRLISCSRDVTVRVWEISSGFCLSTLKGHDEWIRDVTISSDGSLIASCSNDKSIRLWSGTSLECLEVLLGHSHVVECIQFSPETTDRGESLFLASGARDNSIKIWNTQDASCVATLFGHQNWVRSLLFVDSLLLSCGDDKSLRLWQWRPQALCVQLLPRAHPLFVSSIACDRHQRLVASAGTNATIRLWRFH